MRMYANWRETSYDVWRRSVPTWVEPLEFLGDIEGKRILLCGFGAETVIFARAGADVHGLEVSEREVEDVNILVRSLGLRDRIHVQVTAFQPLAYPDAFFDLVLGKAVLQYMDLSAGAKELARVLKAGGRAAFIEPLGMNPALRLARRHRRGKRVLTYRDLDVFTGEFVSSCRAEVNLMDLLRRRTVPNRQAVEVLRLGNAMLRTQVPLLRRFSSQIWIGVEKAA